MWPQRRQQLQMAASVMSDVSAIDELTNCLRSVSKCLCDCGKKMKKEVYINEILI